MAQDNEDRARSHARRGKRLYELGRLPEAVRAFEAAYELSEDPAQLYNLAQSYRRMENHARAIELYQQYLRKVPDAPNRKEIEDRIANLRKSQAPPNQLMPGDDGATEEAAPVPSEPEPMVTPPVVARSTGAAAAPTRRRLHARLLLGVGGSGGSVESYRLAGTGTTLTGAVGWRLQDRLTMFAQVGYRWISEPGDELPEGASIVTNSGLTSLGAGFAFLASPAHRLSVSAAVLADRIDVTLREVLDPQRVTERREAGFGVGGEVVVAKEWPVSARFSVGAALYAAYAGGDLRGISWSALTGGLALTTTFN